MRNLQSDKQKEMIEKTSMELLKVVCSMGNPFGAKAPELLHPIHLQKIRSFVALGKPLHFVLPAFPAKSPNPQKTLGCDPDYAEVLGLQRLQRTCELIQELYEPGASLTICSDGRVFSDLVLVDDETVSRYRTRIEEIITEFQLVALNTFHMEDLFPELDFGEMRQKLSTEFGRPLTEIQEDTRNNEKDRYLFNGIHRFLFEDRIGLGGEKSRNQLREETKELAYQVIQRSNSWSKLVESAFPDAVRLSIHPQFMASEKLAFQLVESENSWATPWHAVALQDQNGFRLMKRKEAIESGAEIVMAGKYAYYRARAL